MLKPSRNSCIFLRIFLVLGLVWCSVGEVLGQVVMKPFDNQFGTL